MNASLRQQFARLHLAGYLCCTSEGITKTRFASRIFHLLHRHNIGFAVLDSFARSQDVELKKLEKSAVLGKATLGRRQVGCSSSNHILSLIIKGAKGPPNTTFRSISSLPFSCSGLSKLRGWLPGSGCQCCLTALLPSFLHHAQLSDHYVLSATTTSQHNCRFF